MEEEKATRDCPVAKGIRKHLQTYMFSTMTNLLTDTLAVVNHMNLMFQTEDFNSSYIQPFKNMTLACLENLKNGPSEVETKFSFTWHHTHTGI